MGVEGIPLSEFAVGFPNRRRLGFPMNGAFNCYADGTLEYWVHQKPLHIVVRIQRSDEEFDSHAHNRWRLLRFRKSPRYPLP